MEMLRVLLSWAVCGLVVGFIPRLLVPRRHRLGLVWTMLLGICGAFVGGLIYWAINGAPGEPFSFSGNAWRGWIFSILGAVLVLLLWSSWGRRTRRGWW
jgi:uncharacterized membrane protein YeaQ/YmgE (transglycosylase-associated protein family)